MQSKNCAPFICQPSLCSNLIPVLQALIWKFQGSCSLMLLLWKVFRCQKLKLDLCCAESLSRDLLSKADQTVGQGLNLAEGLIVLMAGTEVITKSKEAIKNTLSGFRPPLLPFFLSLFSQVSFYLVIGLC